MFDRNHFSSLAALVSLLTSVGYVSPVQADEVLFFDDFRVHWELAMELL